jgi:hypothetical protein
MKLEELILREAETYRTGMGTHLIMLLSLVFILNHDLTEVIDLTHPPTVELFRKWDQKEVAYIQLLRFIRIFQRGSQSRCRFAARETRVRGRHLESGRTTSGYGHYRGQKVPTLRCQHEYEPVIPILQCIVYFPSTSVDQLDETNLMRATTSLAPSLVATPEDLRMQGDMVLS